MCGRCAPLWRSTVDGSASSTRTPRRPRGHAGSPTSPPGCARALARPPPLSLGCQNKMGLAQPALFAAFGKLQCVTWRAACATATPADAMQPTSLHCMQAAAAPQLARVCYRRHGHGGGERRPAALQAPPAAWVRLATRGRRAFRGALDGQSAQTRGECPRSGGPCTAWEATTSAALAARLSAVACGTAPTFGSSSSRDVHRHGRIAATSERVGRHVARLGCDRSGDPSGGEVV